MEELVKCLLDREPWVKYRTRVDLLEQSENESEVIHARKEMIGLKTFRSTQIRRSLAGHLTSLLRFSRVRNQLIYFLSDDCSIV